MLILILILLAVGASLVAARWAFGEAFAPARNIDPLALPEGEQYEHDRPRMQELMTEMAALPYTEVHTEAKDGVTLCGRYYHTADGAPLQIQMHGYHGSAIRDFCGGHKLARESGHNTLVIDQRAHGQSGGRAITFGILEREDCLAWIAFANAHYAPSAIVLTGVSMGAATVLMAADLDLPPNVRAIIADCPYSAPEAIIARVCRARGIPPRLAMPFLRLGARLWGGFSLRAASPLASVMAEKVPILLLHGEDDRFVPCEMSREIARCAGSHCRLETFPDAAHGMSFMRDPRRYRAVVAAFLDDCGVPVKRT
ncbi:MAG: alpha/beta hydrolase [Clostridia bacterium]|nr:alpha/beta hydrolase [Clostridia bacterium]